MVSLVFGFRALPENLLFSRVFGLRALPESLPGLQVPQQGTPEEIPRNAGSVGCEKDMRDPKNRIADAFGLRQGLGVTARAQNGRRNLPLQSTLVACMCVLFPWRCVPMRRRTVRPGSMQGHAQYVKGRS